MTSILVLGATGQIGATFLSAVRKAYPEFGVTAYLRSSSYDEELSYHKINVVHGTFEELDKVIEQVSKHTIVVNAASSTDVNLTKAIIQGLKQQAPGKATILHVSGAGNFLDGSTTGNFESNAKIWRDDNEDDIKQINDSMANGSCDKLILEAGASQAFNTYIVSPVGVHGQGKSDFSIRSSGVLVRNVIQSCIQMGYVPYIGDGTAIFQMVHVDDVVSLMMLVLAKALNSNPGESAYSRYYIAGGVQCSWKQFATYFAEKLHKVGKISSKDAKSVEFDKAGPFKGLLGSSLRCENPNAKSLGYKPEGPTLPDTLRDLVLE